MKLKARICGLSSAIKKLILIGGDVVLIPLSLWLAISLRYGHPVTDLESSFLLFAGLTFFSIPVFARLGLYRAVMRYVGLRALEQIALGVMVSAGILLALMLLQDKPTIPRSSFLIYGFVALALLGGSRYAARYLLGAGADQEGERVAIYGAGSAGRQLVQLMRHSRERRAVVFLDDDDKLQGREIDGLMVLDPVAEDLQQRLEKLRVQQILVSIPSASRGRRSSILERLEALPLHVRTVPDLRDILSGRARLDEIREVVAEDLLGRDFVPAQSGLLDCCIRNKNVLVTGAGGSIGSELARQILDEEPRCLILMELSESALYRIDQELQTLKRTMDSEVRIVSILGNVTDSSHIAEIFKIFKIDTIYHAAAYKHVPLVEHNPVVGLWNNVFGTMYVARQGGRQGATHFVLVSTDKAVRPTSIMGVSKRLSEMVVQAVGREYPDTNFSMVRFGNVLDSSGSVVPLFRKQIREGGPVTVTHPGVTRYFMTIPEAVQLVIQAGAMAKGGEVFVLDMGKPVKIHELAKRMIHLSGLQVKEEAGEDDGIEIRFTGLRPGEKLYEEIIENGAVRGTSHPRIMCATEFHLPWSSLEPILARLEALLKKRDVSGIRELLLGVVESYQPHPEIEDWTWREKNMRPGEQVERLIS